MRAKRSKQYRKLMQQYALNFSFREPYQVLLDAGLIQAAARFQMHLGKMLSNTLHGEIKPMITQCTIRHLYALPTSTPALAIEKAALIASAKLAERRRCGHHELPSPLSELECLLSVVDPKSSGTNKHRYVVAAQDDEIRRRLREVAGVPMVYVKRSVMVLEPMSARTEEVRLEQERGKVRAGLRSRAAGAQVKRKQVDGEGEDGVAEADSGHKAGVETQPRKKRKVQGSKGANPLSVKKAKKEPARPILAGDGEDEKSALRQTISKTSQPYIPTAAREAGGGDDEGVRKRKRMRKRASNDESGGGAGPMETTAVTNAVQGQRSER